MALQQQQRTHTHTTRFMLISTLTRCARPHRPAGEFRVHSCFIFWCCCPLTLLGDFVCLFVVGARILHINAVDKNMPQPKTGNVCDWKVGRKGRGVNAYAGVQNNGLGVRCMRVCPKCALALTCGIAVQMCSVSWNQQNRCLYYYFLFVHKLYLFITYKLVGICEVSLYISVDRNINNKRRYSQNWKIVCHCNNR